MIRKTPAGLCLPLLIALVACSGGDQPPETRKEAPAVGGISLVVRLTADNAQILSMSKTDSPPRHPPSAPSIAPAAWEHIPTGAWELVATFHDADGRPLSGHSYAWTARPMMFDELPPPTGTERTEQARSTDWTMEESAAGPVYDDRLLSLPLPPDAAMLSFNRVGIRNVSVDRPLSAPVGTLVGAQERVDPEEGRIRVEESLLKSYPLDDPGRPVRLLPRFPAPGEDRPEFVSVQPERLQTLDLDTDPMEESESKILFLNVVPTPDECGNGQIVGARRFWESTPLLPPHRAFDIVITGDGFRAQDLDEFNRAAETVANGLLGTQGQPGVPPFSTLRDKINVYIVEVASTQAVTQGCGGSTDSKRTYFGVSGDSRNSARDTACTDFIHETAQDLTGNRVDDFEVLLIIANCASKGGRGKYHSRLALVPNFSDPDKLVDYAAHEIAHVASGLVDEYVSGVSWDCRDPHPQSRHCNLTTRARVQSRSVWWWDLTEPVERCGVDFCAVHKLGDPTDGLCPGTPDMDPPAYQDMLGLFWGCQFLAWKPPAGCRWDPLLNEPPDCCLPPTAAPCHYDDPRGAMLYRPMARCRMRMLKEDNFCDVCAYELTEAIKNGRQGPSQACFDAGPHS